MKDSRFCPKCQSHEIAIIEGGTFKGNMYNTITTGLSTIYMTRYVCTSCGFTENYVENQKDLMKLKAKYYKPNEQSDFV